MRIITLADGAGGSEMQKLIASFDLPKGSWEGTDSDSAFLKLDEKRIKGMNLVFTTDSFTVSPIFFPGGDIGHLAFSGSVNDLLVAGSIPLGLSLAMIIEEGFPRDDLDSIISTIRSLSIRYGVPVVTGDTKVVDKGKIDGIMITTSAVGLSTKMIGGKINPGDKIIISGGIGEHAVALLSRRFDYETDIISDSKPLIEEMRQITPLIKKAKDPTRGGIAGALCEIAASSSIGIRINEERIPIKKAVRSVSSMLGLDPLELASEGRVLCIAGKEEAEKVRGLLKGYNPDAEIIGEVIKGNEVILKTSLGESIVNMPSGRLVPRIC